MVRSAFQQVEDSIAASVAVVGIDQSCQLIVPPCHKNFFNMTGGRPPRAHEFPLKFDALLPSYAPREFRGKQPACFSSGIAQEIGQAYDLRNGAYWRTLSLESSGINDGGAVALVRPHQPRR